MKKLITALLVIAMLGTCMAYAEWVEGKSPENPFGVDRPVDFEKNIGYMLLEPSKNETAEYDVHVLNIFLPRDDVEKVNGGKVYINKADGELIAQITLTDANYTQRVMTEAELTNTGWGCGTVLSVELGCVLPADAEYVIQFEEGFVRDSARNVESAAIAGERSWRFTTGTADGNYIDNMYACRGEQTAEVVAEVDKALNAGEIEKTETEVSETEVSEIPEGTLGYGETYQEGDKIHFSVHTEEEVTAVFVLGEGEADADETWYENDTDVTLTLTQSGKVEWEILWMDESGNVINEDVFGYNVE